MVEFHHFFCAVFDCLFVCALFRASFLGYGGSCVRVWFLGDERVNEGMNGLLKVIHFLIAL